MQPHIIESRKSNKVSVFDEKTCHSHSHQESFSFQDRNKLSWTRIPNSGSSIFNASNYKIWKYMKDHLTKRPQRTINNKIKIYFVQKISAVKRMPPKKGSTKAKVQDLQQVKQQGINLPPTYTSPHRIKSQYLRMYDDYSLALKFKDKQFDLKNECKRIFLRKVGAFQFHHMTDFQFAVGRRSYKAVGNVDYDTWKKNKHILKNLKRMKRLRDLTIVVPTTPSLQRIKFLKRVTSHLPHCSNLKLHILLPTLNAVDFYTEKSEQGLIRMIPKELRCHTIQSARLILQGKPSETKAAKKTAKAKPKEKVMLEHFWLNPLAKLKKLSLYCKEKKYLTAFRPLLEAKVFPRLKELSFETSDDKFSIQNQTETIVDPSIELMEILLGKSSKKNADTKVTINTKSASKPEIVIKGFGSALRDDAQAISALGTIKRLEVSISRTEEGELAEMFSHLKNLRSLAFHCSPTRDSQVREISQGISNLHNLTALDLSFKNYTFSKDSVKEIYSSIRKHSPSLRKLCLRFQDVENLNNAALIMDLVLQIPNLTILRLLLGSTDQKNLTPLRNLVQLKKLSLLEIGGYFCTQYPKEIGAEFNKICRNLLTLRYILLKPEWEKEVNSRYFYHFRNKFWQVRQVLEEKKWKYVETGATNSFEAHGDW